MAVVNFPPVDLADEHGLLALGGDLEVESLLLAYNRGIFPWPISDQYPLAWFCPNPRGIIDFSDFIVGKSLRKFLRHSSYKTTFNRDFLSVIKNCQSIHTLRNQGQTWITDEIVAAYEKLHQAGHAYSVEVWNNQEQLVGGLYGVIIGAYVSGESMFYKAPNASKTAIVSLIERLQKTETTFLDTQMVTPVVASLGGSEIQRQEFLNRLKLAKQSQAPSFLIPHE